MTETIKCTDYTEMSALLRNLVAHGLEYNPGGIGYWWDAQECTVYVQREEEVSDFDD